MEYAESNWIIKINKKWTKRAVVLISVAFVLWALLWPMVCGYTDRSRVAEIIISTVPARNEIARILKSRLDKELILAVAGTIPGEISTRSGDGEVIEIAYKEVTAEGEIKVYSPQLGVMLVFTPTLENGRVLWSCWGKPNKLMPAMCRESS